MRAYRRDVENSEDPSRISKYFVNSYYWFMIPMISKTRIEAWLKKPSPYGEEMDDLIQ